MKRIEWDETFVLGLRDTDSHHKRLVELLGKTHDVVTSGNEELGPVLDELVEYTKYHFKSEELWMLERLYPRLTPHVEAHRKFLAKVTGMQDDLVKGKAFVSMQAVIFLESWIKEHILKMDADYASFLLRGKGALN